MRKTIDRILALLLAMICTFAGAQPGYPDKPIKLIVGFPPGQATDIMARLVADRISRATGQPLIVENRPGQGGSIGLAALAKAPHDGYTMVLAATASMATNPHLYKNIGYDTLKDFAPISRLAEVPLVLVANPSAPFDTVAELVAYAKANPGKLSYSSSGNGTLSHLAMELFKQQAGVSLAHIPYQGSVRAMTDLVSGNVLLGFDTVTVTAPQIASGKLKALGVASASRVPTLAQVPTLTEAGLPGFVASPWVGFLFPKGTPADIVARMNAEIRKAVDDPGVQKSLHGIGAIVHTDTPDEFAQVIRSDYDKWGRLVRDSGARVD
ncbi:Argininosuccinate lyase [Variovorax sp. SRS16]|uniref:Bug family tripartite tricarboxylate transporter substrate binding protein n=1 Tax=Variovorax sp. SRS16 TaxID=282217 RepID=UPI0013166508|nr:tripartite tricarboxylate transporter substrate binding protein [Variovorax sp. SRS16]VTU12866.1 Argininosuccinate lyase [Variovorax sp. SRS16]